MKYYDKTIGPDPQDADVRSAKVYALNCPIKHPNQMPVSAKAIEKELG